MCITSLHTSIYDNMITHTHTHSAALTLQFVTNTFQEDHDPTIGEQHPHILRERERERETGGEREERVCWYSSMCGRGWGLSSRLNT